MIEKQPAQEVHDEREDVHRGAGGGVPCGDCRATIGEVSNDEHNLRKIGKAGAVVIDNSSAWRMDPQVPLVGLQIDVAQSVLEQAVR